MPEKETKRAVIVYRTKPLEDKAKWSFWFQREVWAKDSVDAMTQFYARQTWPVMTGMIEIQTVTWLD